MTRPETVPCPICAGPVRLYDVVDFNKSCVDLTARRSGLSGTPIYYHQCTHCHFIFAPECYAWTKKEFAEKIYNADYVLFDPEFVSERPLINANLVEKMFGNQKSAINHLDFGGGAGILSNTLKAYGWHSSSYDPYYEGQVLPKDHEIDLITAFEVFGHSNTIHELCKKLSELLKPKGAILFSTLISDGKVSEAERLSWWYAAPRNGHISLFSKKSLEILAKTYEFNFISYNDNIHCFYRGGIES